MTFTMIRNHTRTPLYKFSLPILCKSTMQTVARVANQAAKTASKMPVSTAGTTEVNKSYHIQAGRMPQPDKIQPSLGDNPIEPFNSETQMHLATAVTTCDSVDCTKKICNSLSPEECNINEKKEGVVSEHAGNLTHFPPRNISSAFLDVNDFKGQPQPQYSIKETATVPVDREQMKVHDQATAYVSREEIAPQIVNTLPNSSVFKLRENLFNDTDENLPE